MCKSEHQWFLRNILGRDQISQRSSGLNWVSRLTLEQKENILVRVRSTREFPISSVPNPQSDADQLEAAADQAIAACSGDAREAVKALIVANHYLETDLEKLKAAASTGYARGKLVEETKTLPRDRKDWYD
jgi:hypothetical protein